MPVLPETIRLYDLASQVHQLAPWEWMQETDLIGIRLPGMEELAYISVMGKLGNHTAVALYLGLGALQRFNRMHSSTPQEDVDAMRLVLESRQLQAAFCERSGLDKFELAQIKTMGRKYRGENWPSFRSLHPGKAPGPVTAEEASWLVLAMERLLAVAERFANNTLRSFRMANGNMEIFSQTADGNGSFQDDWLPFSRDDYAWPSPVCNQILAAKIGKFPAVAEVECVFFMMPRVFGSAIGERVYAYLLMVADAASGLIMGCEILSVGEQPFEEMINSIPDRFLAICDQNKQNPLRIATASQATAALLAFPAKSLGCKVRVAKHLPALDEAMASMPL